MAIPTTVMDLATGTAIPTTGMAPATGMAIPTMVMAPATGMAIPIAMHPATPPITATVQPITAPQTLTIVHGAGAEGGGNLLNSHMGLGMLASAGQDAAVFQESYTGPPQPADCGGRVTIDPAEMPADLVSRLRLLVTVTTEAETRLTIEEAAREIQILREQNAILRDQGSLRRALYRGEYALDSHKRLCPALRADRLHPLRQARL